MSIIFSSIGPVKTASTRRFGAGLLAFAPHSGRVGYTAADEAEYAEMLADREQAARDFDAHLEERYLRSLADDRVSSGTPWL